MRLVQAALWMSFWLFAPMFVLTTLMAGVQIMNYRVRLTAEISCQASLQGARVTGRWKGVILNVSFPKITHFWIPTKSLIHSQYEGLVIPSIYLKHWRKNKIRSTRWDRWDRVGVETWHVVVLLDLFLECVYLFGYETEASYNMRQFCLNPVNDSYKKLGRVLRWLGFMYV